MLKVVKKLTKLCSPALFYFSVSIFLLLVAAIQNAGNSRMYTLGYYSRDVSSTIFIFALKLIYILFWTWVLNLICKDGYSWVSWVLVLMPIILLITMLLLMILL
jgi:hypothetical protein